MNILRLTAAAGLVLAAFQAPAAFADTAGITAKPAAAVADQLIECTTQEAPGITTSEFFLITNGAVKRYARAMNMARDMCLPDQPDCALGWRDGKIAMYYAMPDGAWASAVIDLDAKTIAKTQATADGDEQSMAGTCTSGAVPAGVSID